VRLNTLLGTLLGFSVAFFLFGLWKGELDWSLWICLMIGGIIGHFIMVNIKERKNNKQL